MALWLLYFQTNHPSKLGTSTLKKEAGCVSSTVSICMPGTLLPQSGSSRGGRISKQEESENLSFLHKSKVEGSRKGALESAKHLTGRRLQ